MPDEEAAFCVKRSKAASHPRHPSEGASTFENMLGGFSGHSETIHLAV